MAAQTALVLNTKSYAPRGKTGEIASWALVGDTTFGGAQSTFSLRVAGPNGQGNYTITEKLIVPKAASEDSSCACVGTELARGEFNASFRVPVGFTAAERDDFTKRCQAAIAHAITTAAATNLEPAW